jgi:hypothetical protein
MKRKEIISLIKKSAFEIMPEVIDKINLDFIIGDSDYVSVMKNKTRFNFTMVLKFASLIIFSLITSIFVYNQLNSTGEVMAMQTQAELIGFPAVSGATLIDQINTISLNQDLYMPLSNSEEPLINETILDNLNLYLNAFEIMIGNKTMQIYTMKQSTNPEYTNLIEYQTTDLLGNALLYQIFYNTYVHPSNNKTMNLNGILRIGEDEYELIGNYIETRSVEKMQWFVRIDEENYIEIEDITHQGRQLFSYKIYQNGTLNSSVQLGLSLIDSNVVGKLKIQNTQETIEYRIRRNSQSTDSDMLMINYVYQRGSQNETGEIDVELETIAPGEYQYRYQIRVSGMMNNIIEFRGMRGPKAGRDSNPGNTFPPGPGNIPPMVKSN